MVSKISRKTKRKQKLEWNVRHVSLDCCSTRRGPKILILTLRRGNSLCSEKCDKNHEVTRESRKVHIRSFVLIGLLFTN
jgi:hypothetical protein